MNRGYATMIKPMARRGLRALCTGVAAGVLGWAGMAEAVTLTVRCTPSDGSFGNMFIYSRNTGQSWSIPDTSVTPQQETVTITGLLATDTLELSAFPVSGKEFFNWSGSRAADVGNTTDAETTFNVGVSGTLFANFGFPQKTLKITTDGNEDTIQPPIGTYQYDQGDTVGLLATPNPGYTFRFWGGETVAVAHPAVTNPTSASAYVNMNDDYSIKAYFSPLYELEMQEASGPGTASVTRDLAGNSEYTAFVPSEYVSAGAAHRYRCTGYANGTGNIVPASGITTFFGPYTVTQNSRLRWTWIDQWRLTVSWQQGGYVTVGGGTNDWYDHGEVVTLYATAEEGYQFNGWDEGGTFLGLGALNVTMDQARVIQALFSEIGGDSDNDGMSDTWEIKYGLDPLNGTGVNGADGDPDNDRLTNFQEFLMIFTNSVAPFQYANPINADTDGDGLDDHYERFRIDEDAGGAVGDPDATNVFTALMDPGLIDINNGPAGNPDRDTRWNTTDGYQNTNNILSNIEEWTGPDGIVPLTYAIVTSGNPGYPLNAGGPPVNRATQNAADTGDQSAGNDTDTDRDAFDDGFEYAWDIWQQANQGTQEVFQIGYLAHQVITNTVPAWDGAVNVTRRFNPGTRHVDSGGTTGDTDFDVLYDYETGGTSGSWYSDILEHRASQPGAFNGGIAGAPQTIARALYPTWERSSHPFYIDVDQDGLPDGYEVIFGYDPWAAVSPGASEPDGVANPDADYMAFDVVETNFHVLVYQDLGFDPRTAWGAEYPQPENMVGPSGAATPNTLPFANLDEARGLDGLLPITPLGIGANTGEDATDPNTHDSDGDGIWDGWENYVGLNPNDPDDAGVNGDGGEENVVNLDEFRSFVTSNTDRNSLTPVAGWLNKIFPTDPFDDDTDADGLLDGLERGTFNGAGDGAWNGRCYNGGALNPCSVDTDNDGLPDPWERMWPEEANGTIIDRHADPDNDKLENYQEYLAAGVYHWQYDFWPAGGPNYDPADLHQGEPYEWDWYYHFDIPDRTRQYFYIPYFDGPEGYFPISSTDPGDVDTDSDGLDDFYECFHGLNPLYGTVDIVATRQAQASAYVLAPLQTGDPRVEPYLIGTGSMDSDGDGLTNDDEGLGWPSAPTHHTDPTPFWVTDTHYANSFVNLYYVWESDLWYYGIDDGMPGPPNYIYSFERNEGYDTDNDNEADYDEVSGGSTDPVTEESPIKRRALYLPLGLDAYARTRDTYFYAADVLREFTIETWVRPIQPALGSRQVIVERPLYMDAGNPLNMDPSVRLNFRVAIDANGFPYAAYNGSGKQYIFEEIKAVGGVPLVADTWTHLAAAYEFQTASSEGTLTLYVNGQVAATIVSSEVPVNGRMSSGWVNWEVPGPILLGAADEEPRAAVSGFGLWDPEPVDFFSGWVDETRIWDGARTRLDIQADMMRRLKKADVRASRISTNGAPYIISLYTVDDLQDPDHDGIAPEGFNVVMSANRPVDWTAVPWWATAPDRSLVYSDYMYLPWINDSAAHLARVPPVDLGDPSVVDTNGNLTFFGNTGNPYTSWYVTGRSGGGITLLSDMLPLRYAVADEDVEMWDGGGLGTDPFDTDGDGLMDGWEEENGFNPLIASGEHGAYADPDVDGLHNLAESRAGTDPQRYYSGTNTYSDFYSWSGIVYRIFGEVFTDFDGMQDEWELVSGLDPTQYDATLDSDDDGFNNLAEFMSSVDDQGCVVLLPGQVGYYDPNDDDSVPYVLFKFTWRYDGFNDNGRLRLRAYKMPERDGEAPVGFALPLDSDNPADFPHDFPHVDYAAGSIDLVEGVTNHFTPGNWWFFSWLDNEDDSRWSPGEPAGIALGEPIRGDWTHWDPDAGEWDAIDVEIGLTDTIPGYGRFRWPEVPGASEYEVRIVNKSQGGSPLIFEPRMVQAPRNYFHEGDYQLEGIHGLWQSQAGYEWFVYTYENNVPSLVASNAFVVTYPETQQVPEPVWPLGATWTYAQNQMRWRMDPYATQFELQVSYNAGFTAGQTYTVVSDTPYLFDDGTYRFTLPLFAGNGAFQEGVYYWRVRGLNPRANSAYSPTSTFTVDLTNRVQGPYSIEGHLGYFGKVTSGEFVVRAYENMSGGGVPVAQATIPNSTSAAGWPLNEIPYELRGLRAGTYYVWAFLDQDGDRIRDDRETYGFARYCAYLPEPLTVPPSITGEMVPLTLTDIDNDKIADDWEYQYVGNLVTMGPGPYNGYTDQAPGGLNDFESYAATPLNVSPFDTGAAGPDGIPYWIKLVFDMSPWEYYAFMVTTVGVDANGAPVVRWGAEQGSGIQGMANGEATVSNNGVTLHYRLQYSEDLIGWTDIVSTEPVTYNAQLGQFEFVHTGHTNDCGFYRVLMSWSE